jgi:hypothetical protein
VNKYAPLFIAVASLIAVIAILAFTFLEIVPRKRYLPPSQLAMDNAFLALERWLNRTGHPVRTDTSPSGVTIPKAGEGVVYVDASFFHWSKRNYELLKPWVEKGGRLLVSLDRAWAADYSQGMDQLLKDLGIGSARFFGAEEAEDDASGEAVSEDGAAQKAGENQTPSPSFDYRIQFDPQELPPEYFSIRGGGVIRLVTVKMGAGSVTIFGDPVFMTNFNLRQAPNARLAWRLTGAEDSEGRGVLFIRGRKPAPGFWSRLAIGWDIPLSLAVVIAVGFWMIIPVFGRLVETPERPGKPIGERFLAEARFFKRYGSLDFYLEPYRETIRQRLVKTMEAGEGKPDEAYCRKLAELCGIDHNRVSELFNPRHPGSLRPREFVRAMETVHTILERL